MVFTFLLRSSYSYLAISLQFYLNPSSKQNYSTKATHLLESTHLILATCSSLARSSPLASRPRSSRSLHHSRAHLALHRPAHLYPSYKQEENNMHGMPLPSLYEDKEDDEIKQGWTLRDYAYVEDLVLGMHVRKEDLPVPQIIDELLERDYDGISALSLALSVHDAPIEFVRLLRDVMKYRSPKTNIFENIDADGRLPLHECAMGTTRVEVLQFVIDQFPGALVCTDYFRVRPDSDDNTCYDPLATALGFNTNRANHAAIIRCLEYNLAKYLANDPGEKRKAEEAAAETAYRDLLFELDIEEERKVGKKIKHAKKKEKKREKKLQKHKTQQQGGDDLIAPTASLKAVTEVELNELQSSSLSSAPDIVYEILANLAADDLRFNDATPAIPSSAVPAKKIRALTKSKANRKAARDAVSEELTCPISMELMRDPVMCADGHSYERVNIEEWLMKSNLSPVTGMELEYRFLVSNVTLKKVIEAHTE